MPYDAIVVGGGIIGAASAYYLARKDMRVALLDQGALASPESSSCDHARIFKLTHGKDSFYTELARKTIPLWKGFQLEAREELIHQNGMLELAVGDGRYEDHCFKVLRDLKIPVQKLSQREVCDRYRMIKFRSFRFAVYHSEGGFVWAKKAIEAYIRLSQRLGVRLEAGAKIVKVIKNKAGVQGLKDSRGRLWQGKNFVFASGAWTKEVLRDFRLPLTVTRQECLYLRPPQNQGRYRPTHFPVFSVASRGFTGLPVHIHGFMKISTHKKGPLVRNPVTPIAPDAKFEGKTRSFLQKTIPDLSGFSDIEGKVYYYTRTPDGDFIVDRLPGFSNALVAAGFSGYGPMFAPLIGETVAELINGEKPALNLQRFRLGRPRVGASPR